MAEYKAILFDLDGTLLPMDMQEFTSGYFKYLCIRLKDYGIDSEKLIAAVWSGTKAMVKNDGTKANSEVFWKHFAELTGVDPDCGIRKDCDSFYENEFNQAKKFTQENPLAIEAVKAAHAAAPIVALATNPLFPRQGQRSRLSWIGLQEADFDMVTDYDTECYCKPSPMFFTEVCRKLKVDPADCLLIGNDELEDMYAGAAAGIGGLYLVTDTVIENAEHPFTGDRGTFSEMTEMLKKLGENRQ